jgi:hypothetical protein
MNIITSDEICHTVFESIYDSKKLPINTKISLELLSGDMDGIFPKRQSWRSFLNGNFREYGELYLNGECKDSTVKRWCYSLGDYIDNFVVKLGADKYVPVKSSELEFKFEWDCNRFTGKNSSDNYPDMVEIFVTAKFKV